jgi:hypothetical protein
MNQCNIPLNNCGTVVDRPSTHWYRDRFPQAYQWLLSGEYSSHPAELPCLISLSMSVKTRIQRRNLLCENKENVDCSCDLLIFEIIKIIHWDATSRQLEVTSQECLSQACADSNHCVLLIYFHLDSN